jgi:hypothetical protein
MIQARCSARIEAIDGSQFLLSLGQAYSNNQQFDKVVHPPKTIVLPLSAVDFKVNLYDITTVKMLMITSDRDIDIKVGSTSNTPIRLRVDVPSPSDLPPSKRGVLLLTADFVNDVNPLATTGLFISNPSGLVTPNVVVAAIGT